MGAFDFDWDQLSQFLRPRERRVLDAARDAGPDGGDAVLLQALATARGDARIPLVAALALCRGPAGAVALRAELAADGPGSESRQATALTALAQRLGADSAADLRGALTNGRRSLRGHAAVVAAMQDVPGLCAEVAQYLQDVLRRPTARGTMPNEAAVAVAYLLGHGNDAVRLDVARTLWRARDRCDSDTRDWISHHWPSVLLCDVEPQTLPDVDVDDIVDWVKRPLRYQEHSQAKWASENALRSST